MLSVHRSERADHLVESLGDLLLDALADPMAVEIVAVPSRGVERWLTQRLSHRLGATVGGDGGCANMEFPFPGTLVGEATSVACGLDPEADPWPPDRSVWPLLEIVDENLGATWLEPLVDHLVAGSPDASQLRRFATVRHLADLFDRYAVHRPDMIRQWVEPVAGTTGARDWQAELWRRLRQRIGVPSPAERVEAAIATLVEQPELLDLPARLSLFGLTRLPASHLPVLEAIAQNREVHLFLLHPSGRLWNSVEAGAEGLPVYPVSRSDDPTASLAVNPLLRSWGRDAREMHLVLRSRGVTGGEHRPVPEHSSSHRTLLERLQSDVRANREPPGGPRTSTEADPRPPIDPGDGSLRVHSCHGRLRQVEVMRDVLLHLLADDPTLEPRDIIVMCPDVESFAPLIHAVFGSSNQPTSYDGEDAHWPKEPGPPQVRARIADRSIRQTNPVLSLAAKLLELASGRLPASEVLDLAGSESVARRFHFDEDELGQLERWVGETGIRWGLDREHRAPWHLGHVPDNTWHAGLDRLLLGVAMAEEEQRLFNDVLPLDDVSSGDVELAGRFAEFVDRLGTAVERLQGRHPVTEWVASLAEATESLALAAPGEQWQHDQLHWVLGDVEEAAQAGESGQTGPRRSAQTLLALAEVRSLLDDRLRGRPTRANFRTGDLTICTLVPMRSVPHRVIGLLGLDDGAFPRHAAQDGDDLLLTEPRVGDRDARSEDRQLLLDALLAATEHLVLTYEGRDPRTNQERSPCVPVAELLDVVDRTVRVPDGSPHTKPRQYVVVEHPLQSFDPRNFQPGALDGDGSWSFDPVDLEGARAHSEPPAAPASFLAAPLEPIGEQVVQLDSLVRFLEFPVRQFLRERLGWYGSGGSDEVKDALPVELDPLEKWGVGERILQARLAGSTPDEARAAEKGRGLLPPGALATHDLGEVEQAVDRLVAVTKDAGGVAVPDSVEVNLRLPDGRTLIGTVPDVHELEDEEGAKSRIVRCLYSRLAAKHRLVAWAHFLALTAAHPEREVTALTVGRAEGSTRGAPRIAVAELALLAPSPDERRERALLELAALVDLYDRGMREPLPLFATTSERFVSALRREGRVVDECHQTWDASDRGFSESQEPAHLLVLGGQPTFSDLLREPARSDESGPGWSSERSRVGRLARRLWEPVLDHEDRRYC